MSTVVIMPGGFHPFHAGHLALYQSAQRAFPDAEVFVAATNDTSARPFPFAVKEKLAKLAGVDAGHFVQVKSPFRAEEITAQFNPATDTLIFVRSDKDANKPPQAGGIKKDGNPAYLQPLIGAKRLEPFAKHAYDNFKKPTEKVVDRSNYSGFQRSRSGVRPMDQFMFNMYFINQIENLVRPTESYIEMVSDGVVTKEQFLKFLLNSKTYKTLVQIRDSSFDTLVEDLKGYETEIDDYLNNTVDNYDSSSLDIDDKVKYFLKVFAFTTARKVHEVRKQLLTPVTNLFQMLFGGNDNPEADKFLDSTLGDLVKMMDNPNKFYYTSIENMRKIAIKMMKKLSKLYSLINKDKTITVETRDPMSFEMDQLYRKLKKKDDDIIYTKIDERLLKKK